MSRVFYLDRKTKKVEEEKIYGEFFLKIFYGSSKCSSFFSNIFLPLFVKFPYFSRLYGAIQKKKITRKNIAPFIEKYQILAEDFIEPNGGYLSFNDFFIRKLQPHAREIDRGEKKAILPADGRYLVFTDLSQNDRFFIKGQRLSLKELTCSEEIAKRYEKGSLVIGRLCPTDYHRFHFPFHCIPSESLVIAGSLYSVNPLALRKNLAILSENKRVITRLDTVHFGEVLYIEVGATAVGSIKQTFSPYKPCHKGDEKGYFEFGGSTVLLLFEPHRIAFDEDLLAASKQSLEVKGFMGESLGTAIDGFFRL